jgi:pSer/pThr/pTyr-binding forkhead associated (FHA) protein
VIFENRCIEHETGKTRVLTYIISVPENNEITMGRNHTSQVLLRDISVSRNHCTIINKHGGLYLQDRKSKFGTLIRSKIPV